MAITQLATCLWFDTRAEEGAEEEVDRLWTALTADGGKDSACGWVKDRFGVSWQLIPDGLMDLMFNGDDASRRAWDALMTMRKIDIAAVRAAHEGV